MKQGVLTVDLHCRNQMYEKTGKLLFSGTQQTKHSSHITADVSNVSKQNLFIVMNRKRKAEGHDTPTSDCVNNDTKSGRSIKSQQEMRTRDRKCISLKPVRTAVSSIDF